MEENIRAAMKKSKDALHEMQDKLEGLMADLPEGAEEIRGRTEKTLHRIAELLKDAGEKAETGTREAQLQAHLGLMEAHEKLDASRVVMNDQLSQVVDKTKSVLDEAELKRHLAVMEAEDFWDKHGEQITAEFENSQAAMLSLANRAANEMKDQFKRWGNVFSDIKKP